MKIMKYHAEATGVNWYAVRNRKYKTPWCMSLLEAVILWFTRRDLEETED